MAGMTQSTSGNQFVKLGIAGAVGGIVGGIAFGVMMGMMGMLPMIASLAGSQSAIVGFILHMGISIFIGVTFGLLFGERSQTYQAGAVWGLLYGVVWWILGPMVIMPLMMGMGLQFGAAFTGPMLMSLLGHLIYGALTGLVFVWYWQNRA